MSRVLFAVPAQVHLLDVAGPAQAVSTAVDEGAGSRYTSPWTGPR